MSTIFRLLCVIGLVAGFSAFAFAANQTLTGTISDSMCGASHAKMAAAHPEAKMTDRDCTLACVKGGGKYVLISSGKVYTIANQNLAALQEQAGRTVSVTGDVTGDSITVATVKASGGKKK
jgi:hypothetical protein